ncbi:MAG: photosynthetic complex putative assembly protein PuhB [Pseudomonadota bacterium]
MAQDHGHDDFQVEPIRGLPELPPEGERILWQGAPEWRALAWRAFGLPWVIGYFAAITLWRASAVMEASPSIGAGLQAAIGWCAPLALLGAGVCAVLALMAYVQAKATVYTITNRRVAMRIGAALTVTLNLPYRWIGSADLLPGRRGVGTIRMQLLGSTRLSYLVCWPHVRPWRVARTEPCLRCVPEAERVASILGAAAEARLEQQATLERPAALQAASIAAE